MITRLIPDGPYTPLRPFVDGPQAKAVERRGETGLCSAWCVLYVYLRVLNAEHPRDIVFEDMMRGTPSDVRSRILRFITYVRYQVNH